LTKVHQQVELPAEYRCLQEQNVSTRGLIRLQFHGCGNKSVCSTNIHQPVGLMAGDRCLQEENVSTRGIIRLQFHPAGF